MMHSARFGSAAATLLVGASALVAVNATPAYAQSTATSNGANQLQVIDGFGFSEFFGRANIMRGSEGLPAQRQQEVLDLLLRAETGAGLSILRLGIGSTPGTSHPAHQPGRPERTTARTTASPSGCGRW